MRSLAFNSVENEFCENFGGSQDLAKWRVNNADGFFKEDQKSIRYECVYRQNNGFGWKSTPTIVSHKTLLINTIQCIDYPGQRVTFNLLFSICSLIEGTFLPSIQLFKLDRRKISPSIQRLHCTYYKKWFKIFLKHCQ